MSNIATVVMTNESEVICSAVNVNTFATLLTVWLFMILSKNFNSEVKQGSVI